MIGFFYIYSRRNGPIIVHVLSISESVKSVSQMCSSSVKVCLRVFIGISVCVESLIYFDKNESKCVYICI